MSELESDFVRMGVAPKDRCVSDANCPDVFFNKTDESFLIIGEQQPQDDIEALIRPEDRERYAKAMSAMGGKAIAVTMPPDVMAPAARDIVKTLGLSVPPATQSEQAEPTAAS